VQSNFNETNLNVGYHIREGFIIQWLKIKYSRLIIENHSQCSIHMAPLYVHVNACVEYWLYLSQWHKVLLNCVRNEKNKNETPVPSSNLHPLQNERF
jgi:hypothetical protein